MRPQLVERVINFVGRPNREEPSKELTTVMSKAFRNRQWSTGSWRHFPFWGMFRLALIHGKVKETKVKKCSSSRPFLRGTNLRVTRISRRLFKRMTTGLVHTVGCLQFLSKKCAISLAFCSKKNGRKRGERARELFFVFTSGITNLPEKVNTKTPFCPTDAQIRAAYRLNPIIAFKFSRH